MIYQSTAEIDFKQPIYKSKIRRSEKNEIYSLLDIYAQFDFFTLTMQIVVFQQADIGVAVVFFS